MRLFIALDLPDSVKNGLTTAQHAMQAAALPVRWTARASIHLTVVFLGDTDGQLLPDIRQAVRAALASQATFNLATAGLGAFPSRHTPQVLWVGVGGDTSTLAELQERVAAAVEPLGFPRERRRYSPHLTLGRLRESATPAERHQLALVLEQANSPPHTPWHVDAVTIFESTLQSGGSVYTVHDTIALSIRSEKTA